MRRKLSTHILRTALFSVLAGTMAATAIFLGAYIAFPLEGVTIKGARMLPESDVERLVSSRSSLLTLNTLSLQREIESNPWVESARVNRDWQKYEVVVDVDERTAVLRVNVAGEEEVLASDGTVLPGTGGVELPLVELESWRVQEVLAAARVLEEGNAELQSVDSVGAAGIAATVADRRVLLSDSVEVEQAESLEDVIRENPRPATFDLRSPGRVIVSEPGPADRADVSGAGKTTAGPQDPENPAG